MADNSNPIDPVSRDLMIRTVLGEAGDQGDAGQAAVAHVIINRYLAGGYGKTPGDVVLAKGQFEPWQTRSRELVNISPNSPAYKNAGQIVDEVTSGQLPDPTGGATHFLDPSIVRARRGGSLPDWAQGPQQQIGQHTFYRPDNAPSADPEGDALVQSLRKGTAPAAPAAAPAASTPAPGAAAPVQDSEAEALIQSMRKGANAPAPAAAPTRDTIPVVPWGPQESAAIQERQAAEAPPAWLPAEWGPAYQNFRSIQPGQTEGALVDATGQAIGQQFSASKDLAASGVADIFGGNYLPTFPSADPKTWTAGGLLKAGSGILGMPASVISGPASLVGEGATQLTGNPDFGAKTSLLSSLLVPLPKVGAPIMAPARIATAALPAPRAASLLVHAIGDENIPSVLERLENNPNLRVADVSETARTLGGGLAADPSNPAAQNIMRASYQQSAAGRRAAAIDAFEKQLGPAPNVKTALDSITKIASDTGKNVIQPALEKSGPVDTSGVIAAIDRELKPGLQAVANPGLGTTPSTLQQSLMRLRNQLVDDNGSQIIDAQKLHGIQSQLREQAYQLTSSATGSDRWLGNELYGFRNQLVDAIDEASKTANPIPKQFRDVQLNTPSGKTDSTGLWFLDGDKPVYSQATPQGARGVLGARADELNDYPSMSGKDQNGHPITVWYKPGQEALAQRQVSAFSSPQKLSSDVGDQIGYHVEQGRSLGYPESAVDSYVRQRFGDDEVNKVLGAPTAGPYKQGLKQYADAKTVREAFDRGYSGLRTQGTDDFPEYWQHWADNASPYEMQAARLGMLTAIRQKIGTMKQSSNAGETIPDIGFTNDRMRILFGDRPTAALMSGLQDVKDSAETNARWFQNSKTSTNLAAMEQLKIPPIAGDKSGGINLLSLPMAGEFIGGHQGGALGLALAAAAKGGRLGYGYLANRTAAARNTELADLISSTGPKRDQAISILRNRLDAISGGNKFSDLLSLPFPR